MLFSFTYVVIFFEILLSKSIAIMNQNWPSCNFYCLPNFEIFCVIIIFRVFNLTKHYLYVLWKKNVNLMSRKITWPTSPFDIIESGFVSRLSMTTASLIRPGPRLRTTFNKVWFVCMPGSVTKDLTSYWKKSCDDVVGM